MTQIYFAPAGTTPRKGDWQQIGMITDDGIQVPESVSRKFSIQQKRQIAYSLSYHWPLKDRRHLMRRVGVYRLRGDKPLIHNGKKPRK